MRFRKWKKGGALLLIVSLAIVALGGYAVWQHRRAEDSKKDTEGLDEYIRLKMELDNKLADLNRQYREISATLSGTVMLMFDQCAPNAYDVVYQQMSEFKMTGCLVFRDLLPGDEGAITAAQWTEMQNAGWTAVMGSSKELLATLGDADYAERLADHAERMIGAFEALGFRAPTAYSFAEGEYSDETLSALTSLGFVTFTASDLQTEAVDERVVTFKEIYLCADPKAPLLQSMVNGIRDKADALVIKTRYVMEVADITKDTDLSKFRLGMLPTLAAYRMDGTLRIETSESAIGAYRAQLDILSDTERKKEDLQAQMDAVKAEMDALWKEYRQG